MRCQAQTKSYRRDFTMNIIISCNRKRDVLSVAWTILFLLRQSLLGDAFSIYMGPQSKTGLMGGDAMHMTVRDSDFLEPSMLSSRRCFLRKKQGLLSVIFLPTTEARAKCTDVDSCREIGEQKVERDMQANPTTVFPSGVRYKVLKPGIDASSSKVVQDGSSIDIIFSISSGGGAYMYSRGFGFEKVDMGLGGNVSDLGLDSLRVKVGNVDHGVPIGIEEALIGMARGERRRVELPPSVGFETSDWNPQPTTRRGKASIVGYQRTDRKSVV